MEARQPEAAEVVSGLVSLDQVGNNTADPGTDAEAVTAHSRRDEKTADCLYVIHNRDDVGHGVYHAAPAGF